MKKISYCFKKKKLLHSLLSLGLGVLLIVSLFPIPIHAQALTSPFLGINFQVTAYGENMSSIVLPKINFDYISGSTPSATISGQLNCTSPSTPTSSYPCDVFSFQNTSGQGGSSNGTRIYLNLQQYLLDANGNATINHQSYFFIDYEFILDDNYKGYVTISDADSNTRTIYVNGNQFHYQRMQLDTTEKAITIDEYVLTRVSDNNWDFPLESLPIIMYPLNNYDVYGITKGGGYYYPIFKISNDFIMTRSLATRSTYYFIFVTDLNIANYGTGNDYSLEHYVVLPSGITDIKFEEMYNSFPLNSFQGKMIKVTFTYAGNSYLYWKFQNISGDHYYMPIYYGDINNKYLSSEFAEMYGLMRINSASSNLDDTNTQFQTDANSLISIEDSFNSSLNSNLDNINPTFNMGSSFLASANWVSTQFNRIVNNTPFASLITFGLTLGLGLLIIGKIRK